MCVGARPLVPSVYHIIMGWLIINALAVLTGIAWNRLKRRR
jgi:hypothetical protein